MFTLDISPLLASYTGDTQTLSFDAEVPAGIFPSIELIAPLVMRVTLTTTDDGISAHLDTLTTKARHQGAIVEVSIQDSTYEFRHDNRGDGRILNNTSINLQSWIAQELSIAIER